MYGLKTLHQVFNYLSAFEVIFMVWHYLVKEILI